MHPKADFFTGIGIILFSGLFFVMASQLPASASGGIGAGGYPIFISSILAFLGAVLSLQSAVRIRAGMEEEKKVGRKELAGVAALAASFFLYLTAVRYLGFLVSTPVFLALFLFQYGERGPKRILCVSLAATVVIYFLFRYAFQVYLPRGYLW